MERQKVSLQNCEIQPGEMADQLNGKAWNSLYWNNHDQPRVVSRFGNDDPKYRVVSAKCWQQCCTVCKARLSTVKRNWGMTNTTFNSLSDYRDLESINAYHQLVDEEHLVDGKDNEQISGNSFSDNARTPMQWMTARMPDFRMLNLGSRSIPTIQRSTRHWRIHHPSSIAYQKLIQMRHDLPVMTEGKFALVNGNELDEQVFAYTTRDDGEQRCL